MITIRELRNIYNILHNCMMKLDPETAMHLNRVAYLGFNYAVKNNLNERLTQKLVTACYLHDIGMIATRKVDNLIVSESDTVVEHSAAGHVFFQHYVNEYISNVVLHHHTPYNKISNITDEEKYLANAVNIIDRIELILNDGTKCSTCEELTKNIETYIKYNADEFSEQHKKECRVLLNDEVLDSYYDGSYIDILGAYINISLITEEQYETMLDSVVYLIESHSDLTAAHSHVVAIIAKELAKIFNKNETEQKHLYYAGLLHDIGKIAIPAHILKSDKRLTPEEYEIMKTHSALTREIIEGNVRDEVFYPCISHHENNQGTGYPTGHKDLTLEQQIVRMADMFTALSEDRYYRPKMEIEKVMEIIKDDYQKGHIDEIVYRTVADNANKLYETVQVEEDNIVRDYKKTKEIFNKAAKSLCQLHNGSECSFLAKKNGFS